MDNRRRWAIIQTYRDMENPTKQAAKEEAKRQKEEAKAAAKIAKEEAKVAAKVAKAAAKQAERDAKEAAKQEEKEAKARARAEAKVLKETKKPALTESPPVPDMSPYPKADLIRTLAEEVYQALGAGHLESVYHRAMEVQLRLANLPYESERVMDLTFKDHFVGVIRADIILAKECVLEFKISGKMDDAVQQARQYMKLQGLAYGYVVMFPKTDGAAVKMIDARLPDALDL